MPTRFSYEELRAITSNFNDKLGEGGFASVFQGTLSDGTKVAMERLNGFGQVFEGLVGVQNNLDYNFTTPVVPRPIAAAGHQGDAIGVATLLFASALSGPR
ncbi:G-type lectin S-receptor-like serine/threonine-protein kinase SD2-5 [Camellia lanceoleosa]|uniref:G-type lectin S-receptor-like serine/threonine-protein kinase SD2-5 n=1 Tax=Camellia lanceoleosa TaxID=1840588 RepID=A0ACC0H2E6_9ERIC|nr:G-type lectin S-receptor-like serine/threonine-protein kinase SD2-5 [Camellia lanceoleosa]